MTNELSHNDRQQNNRLTKIEDQTEEHYITCAREQAEMKAEIGALKKTIWFMMTPMWAGIASLVMERFILQ